MTTDTTHTDQQATLFRDEIVDHLKQSDDYGEHTPFDTDITSAWHEGFITTADTAEFIFRRMLKTGRIVAERATPALSDEAIEAAARELVPGDWRIVPERSMDHYRRDATAALTAAMPFIRAALQPAPTIDLPEWANHVRIEIGAHYHEWWEGKGRNKTKTWQWRRSCWGEGATLQDAVADMNRKSCVTDEAWGRTLELNPHIRAAIEAEAKS